jgi:hypothetical protein
VRREAIPNQGKGMLSCGPQNSRDGILSTGPGRSFSATEGATSNTTGRRSAAALIGRAFTRSAEA